MLVRLDERLHRVENSIIFRTLREVGRLASLFVTSVLPRSHSDLSRRWSQKTLVPTDERAGLAPTLSNSPVGPTVSVLVYSEHNDPNEYTSLVCLLESQPYNHWEVLTSNVRLTSAGKQPAKAFSEQTPKKIFEHPNQHGWPSIEAAAGEIILFFEPGDRLLPETLTRIIQHYNESGSDVIYSDEGILLDDGRTIRPIFKPDYSPHLLVGPCYPGRALVVKKATAIEVGGLCNEYGPFADYDLYLRLSDRGRKITHLPQVLYVRKDRQNDRRLLAQRAVEEALLRRNEDALVLCSKETGMLYLARRPKHKPKVSLIIATRTPQLLRTCLKAVVKLTSYGDYEIVVAHHEGDAQSANHSIRILIREFGALSITYTGPFNYSIINNRAAAIASGEVFVFINDDVTPLNQDWLQHMVAALDLPAVGVVGARLHYPDQSLQHAGIVVGLLGYLGHVGRYGKGSPHFPWLSTTRNVSAVTGACLGIRREVFESLRGFDPQFDVNFNDVDLCFRAKDAGFEVVLEAQATLIHRECQTRERRVRLDEFYRFQLCWGAVLKKPDPYYSPSLSLKTELIELSLSNN